MVVLPSTGTAPSSHWSPLSSIYAQYHRSLRISKKEYAQRLVKYAKMLDEEWERCLREHIFSFTHFFSDPTFRLIRLRNWAESFFGTSDIPFVAIDGSSHIEPGDRFISIYGGAYGSRGVVSISGEEGRLIYRRWEFSKDVSMVAFIPIPPEAGESIVEAYIPEAAASPVAPLALSDRDVISYLSLIHI